MYVSLVKSHSEYALQELNHRSQGGIENIERVQGRVTRIPIGFEDLEYEERLQIFSLTTLKD